VSGAGGERPGRDDFFLSVVLSFYNEEEVLPELIRRLRSVLRPLCGDRYELIFVDDDSTDRSAEVLAAESEGQGDIKVITMSRNFGISVCAMAGIRHARGHAVVTIDADLQDPPEVIPALVDAWLGDPGVEVVHTVRSSRLGESSIKMLITRIGYRILGAVSEVRIIPDAGDFKLLSRRAVDVLLATDERKPFLRGLASWVGFRQASVTYQREARFKGVTKCPVYSGKVVNYFLDTALVSFSATPLKLILLVGLLVTAGGTLFLATLLAMRIGGWPTPPGSLTAAGIVLLAGFQLTATGFLGLYINAVLSEVRRRPGYVVKGTRGFGDGERTAP
jgi:dolichol-phosphate mannosyltransferase